MAKYRFRQSVFTKPTTYETAADRLTWRSEEGASGELLYDEIKSIRLKYDPTRFESNRYVANIQSEKGDGLKFVNMSFRGAANFESHNEEYRVFIKELILEAKKQNPAILLHSGNKPAGYIMSWVMAVFGGLALFFALGYFYSEENPGFIWVKVAVLVLYLLLMPAYLKKNRPRSFDAEDIPADVLP